MTESAPFKSWSHKLLSSLTLIFYLNHFFCTSPALCQDRQLSASHPDTSEYMVALSEGEAAPFDGTLLNVPAAARILTDMRQRDEVCRIETRRQLGFLEANMQLLIDAEVARRESLQYRHEQLMTIRDQQIEFLTSRIRQPEFYERGEFWFSLGAVAGIAITVLSAVVLNLVSSHPATAVPGPTTMP